MNYLKLYLKLIRKAQIQEEPEIYEKHHVFPKSIYGKNNFIVKLTPRQHYIAHALLCNGFIQRYGKKDTKSIKMMRAFKCMHITNINKYNSRLYEKLRSNFLEMQRGESHPLFGKSHKKETKYKISEANKGRLSGDKNPMFGKFGKDHPRFGQNHTEEAKRKIGISRQGEKHPLFGYIGEKNPFFGKEHTEETKAIISAKASERSKGRKWWTNGANDRFCRECPVGYWAGRSSTKKK